MYNNLKNNIQTGNDRINRLKSKILSHEYKIKYNGNRVNYNIKNNTNTCTSNTFHKLPYIQNNSDKLLITRGFFHCSSNKKFDKQVLDSNNNHYSQKIYNDYFIYNTGIDKTSSDLSFNTLTYTDISENTEVFIVNKNLKKIRKQQLVDLNKFNIEYENCNKVYKQSSVKIYDIINGGRSDNSNNWKKCNFLNPE